SRRRHTRFSRDWSSDVCSSDLTEEKLPVKGYASHGESWSFALALRLASYDLLRADGDDPILVLDDVFAELDAERRAQLADLVAEIGRASCREREWDAGYGAGVI